MKITKWPTGSLTWFETGLNCSCHVIREDGVFGSVNRVFVDDVDERYATFRDREMTSIGTDQTFGAELSFCAVGSITSRRLWRLGRRIPSFCILLISVVRLKPSLAAAPAAPPTTQPTASNVRRISSRSASLNVVGGPKLACLDVARKGFRSTPSFERITARSIRFCSSRIFPGHSYELKRSWQPPAERPPDESGYLPNARTPVPAAHAAV